MLQATPDVTGTLFDNTILLHCSELGDGAPHKTDRVPFVFIGGGDGYLYAFDKKTGKEIWRGRIPYENTAVPMTYRTKSGKQLIVVATGSGTDNALVAFALK